MTVPTTKADEIAYEIEQEIISGRLPAGSVLRQEQLSERFAVSRTPIREALRKLAALGVVDFVPNRGVQVRAVPRDELREAFLIRAELEGLAVELATPLMTPADLDELRRAEKQFEQLTLEVFSKAATGEPPARLLAAWVHANEAFHDVILRGAHAPLLDRVARSVRRVFQGQAAWARGQEVRLLYEQNLRQHRLIREAIEMRSARAARALMIDHVLSSGTLLETALGRIEHPDGEMESAREDALDSATSAS